MGRKRQTNDYEQVRERLREQIMSGVYPPGSRLPTEVELPKMFRVGRHSVLRALSDLVREGLIVRRRGSGSYVADVRYPAIVPGKHARIAVLWPENVMPEYLLQRFQGKVTLGILGALGMRAAQPVWETPRRQYVTKATWTLPERSLTVDCLGQTAGSRARHPSLRIVKAGDYDALLAVSVIEEYWLAKVIELGLPTILVDFPNRRFTFQADQVFADPECAYTQAVQHFMAKGLKRVHYVGCEMARPAPWEDMSAKEWIAWKKGREGRPDPDSLLRLGVYWRAMREAGVDVPAHWIHEAGHESGACESLAEKMLAMGEADRPQAIVCHDLAQCRRIVSHFRAKGEALEGTGAFEAKSGGDLVIRADPERLGAAAAELLTFRIQHPTRHPVRVGVPMVFDAKP